MTEHEAWLSNPHNLAASLIAAYLLVAFGSAICFRQLCSPRQRDEMAAELASQGAAAPLVLAFAVLIAPFCLLGLAWRLGFSLRRDDRGPE